MTLSTRTLPVGVWLEAHASTTREVRRYLRVFMRSVSSVAGLVEIALAAIQHAQHMIDATRPPIGIETIRRDIAAIAAR